MNPQGINDLIRIELDEAKDALKIARAAIYSAITVLAGDGNEKIKNTRASLILSNARDGRFVVTPTGPDLAEENRRLQADNERLKDLANTRREQCTKATERADQAEYMLKAGGLSDVNHYMTQIKELQAEIDGLNMVLAYQPEEGAKDRHIRTQAVEIASLRNRLKLLQMGQQTPQEWHDDPPEQERFDLP